MTREQFVDNIMQQIMALVGDRDFNYVLSALIAELHRASDTRLAYEPIRERMFERLNEGRDEPYTDRPSSAVFNVITPFAWTAAELNELVENLRDQVFVHSAHGKDLDTLGIDWEFPRFEATQALRIGFTRNAAGDMADFPIGSRFMTRDSGVEPLIFTIDSTSEGNVIWRSEAYGDIGNHYSGDLSLAQHLENLGRASITDEHGAYRPGQNRESDEEYRRRFLAFLRFAAFSGNVADYMRFTQAIDGVGQLTVHSVPRGGGSTKIHIVDSQNHPVSDEFVAHVNNKIDPMVRSGAGMGTAPVGHRVFVSTPEWYDVDITMRAVLMSGMTAGQVMTRAREVVERYFVELRQGIIDEWERTFFGNIGIRNTWVDVQLQAQEFKLLVSSWDNITAEQLDALLDYAQYSSEWMPAEAVKESHIWHTHIIPQEIGVIIRQARLVSVIDWSSILLNGIFYHDFLDIEQSEEGILYPRLRNMDIEFVDFISPQP